MKKFIEEFKQFIAKGNALQMAIGVVIGGAFGAITSSLVADVITPLLAAIFKSPNPDALNITLRAATADSDAIVLGLGTFIGTVINFLVIALVIFSVMKAANKASELAKAAMKKKDDGTFAVNGQKVLIPFIYKSTDNMMIQMLRQLDAGYSTDDGKILLFNDETAALLKEIAVHAKSKSFSTFKISSYPGNYLNAGQCIFAVDSTAGATWMGHDAHNQDIPKEQMVKFEIAVQPVPQFDTAAPKMISQGPSVCIFNKSDPQEVLASWLFAQFLLTNDVQIAYSQTEGYVPVTLKAQNSDAYQDYLSRSGEDNDTYYHVKIDAAKLLLDNVDDTFVTPVFNGSASLRNAAGTLVEQAVKNGFRQKDTDDAFITKLYDDTIALYHLDRSAVVDPAVPATEPETQESGETVTAPETQEAPAAPDTQPLPQTARTLIICLVIAWIGIAAVWIWRFIKSRREKK